MTSKDLKAKTSAVQTHTGDSVVRDTVVDQGNSVDKGLFIHTVNKCANVTGLSAQSISFLIKSGKIPAIKAKRDDGMGAGKYMISEEGLNTLLKNHKPRKKRTVKAEKAKRKYTKGSVYRGRLPVIMTAEPPLDNGDSAIPLVRILQKMTKKTHRIRVSVANAKAVRKCAPLAGKVLKECPLKSGKIGFWFVKDVK